MGGVGGYMGVRVPLSGDWSTWAMGVWSLMSGRVTRCGSDGKLERCLLPESLPTVAVRDVLDDDECLANSSPEATICINFVQLSHFARVIILG